jgi:glycosyltransferase involved in cell wall biosynthesis
MGRRKNKITQCLLIINSFLILAYKILLFQRILPAYRVPLFKILYELHGVLTCYSLPTKNNSLASAISELKYPSIRLKRFQYGNTPTAIIQNPLSVILRFKPNIIISEGAPSYLTLWLLLLFRIILNFKLVIWGHGIRFNELEAPFKNFRGAIQLWLFNRADSVLTYSDIRADVLKKYINQPSKVFVARNTLDTDYLKKIYENLSKKGKEKIKHELNFHHKFNLIFIGRLLTNKGLDDLLEAFLTIENKYNVELHIIGDGPEVEKVKRVISTSQNVRYYGSIFDFNITSKMLYASDLMIMPGNVGLSIVHAFSFGCPIITYKSCGKNGPVHGPEIEYLKDKINGVLCEKSPDKLAEEIGRLINNPSVIKEFSANAIRTAYNDASVSVFLDGFQDMLNYLHKSKL